MPQVDQPGQASRILLERPYDLLAAKGSGLA